MDILEKRLEKTPGLVLLFAILAVLLLEETSEITAAGLYSDSVHQQQ